MMVATTVLMTTDYTRDSWSDISLCMARLEHVLPDGRWFSPTPANRAVTDRSNVDIFTSITFLIFGPCEELFCCCGDKRCSHNKAASGWHSFLTFDNCGKSKSHVSRWFFVRWFLSGSGFFIINLSQPLAYSSVLHRRTGYRWPGIIRLVSWLLMLIMYAYRVLSLVQSGLCTFIPLLSLSSTTELMTGLRVVVTQFEVSYVVVSIVKVETTLSQTGSSDS